MYLFPAKIQPCAFSLLGALYLNLYLLQIICKNKFQFLCKNNTPAIVKFYYREAKSQIEVRD